MCVVNLFVECLKGQGLFAIIVVNSVEINYPEFDSATDSNVNIVLIY